MNSFRIHTPTVPRTPILLSVPHCGTAFPEEIVNDYEPELIKAPDDTDWFVDQLYGFAPSLGITMITATFSRWVIDLNRNPDSTPLYADGRIITELCPATTFLGLSLYRDSRKRVDEREVERRKALYFFPYHEKVRSLLSELKEEFGSVLLWDCHSIRKTVPTIQKESFPDMILGSADGRSAHPKLIETALDRLSRGKYSLQHNHPFKGGYITRAYGKPQFHQHALQLEMSKINYMDDRETDFHRERAEQIAELLTDTLGRLANALISLKDQ